MKCLTQLCTGAFQRSGEVCAATGFSGSKGGCKFLLSQIKQHRKDIKFLYIKHQRRYLLGAEDFILKIYFNYNKGKEEWAVSAKSESGKGSSGSYVEKGARYKVMSLDLGSLC